MKLLQNQHLMVMYHLVVIIISYLNHLINNIFYIGTEEAREAVAKLWSRDGFVLDSKVSHKCLMKIC
jgi:hypothetical protein